MNRAKLIVIAGFVVAFGAGMVSGMLGRRTVAEPPKPQQPHRKPFAELNLSPDQERQMREIWSGVMKYARDHDDLRRKARDERVLAVAALMKESGRETEYGAIQKKYTDKLSELDRERKKLFDEAVDKTTRILNPEQRKKYEEMRKKRDAEGRGRGPGPRPEERATSRPVN
jgi:Spy/CpxP family protein refolding chaperone